jgi:hypothetical protein
MSALGSIREKCRWCSNDQPKEIRLCPAESCPEHPYRLGTMPKIPKPSPLKAVRAKCLDCSESTRKAASERLKTRCFCEKTPTEREIFKGTAQRL